MSNKRGAYATDRSGHLHALELADDDTLMDACVRHLVPGIGGDCGGACACGTCVIVVNDAWQSTLQAPSDAEEMMLSACDKPQHKGMRLACQIRMQSSLHGVQFKVA